MLCCTARCLAKIQNELNIFFNNSKISVAESIIVLSFPAPTNLGKGSWKTEVITLNYQVDFKVQLALNFNNITEDIEFPKTYSTYQTL